MSDSSTRRLPPDRWPLLVFFLSGTAALIYELVWFHLVQLVVGASSISVAALLASLMGGMALGSVLLPRVVSVVRHPWRVVAALEVAIAIVGLSMPFLLPIVRDGYLALVGSGYAGVLARAAVCAVALLPPTLLMGATLPAAARWTQTGANGAALIGRFYMANIAGGAFGTALAGFYLLRVFDTLVATTVAVALNLIAAALALVVARRHAYTPPALASATADSSKAPTSDEADASPPDRSRAIIYAVAGLSGLTALGAEVVWTRQMSLLFGASVYTFSLILAVFLAGLGLGSLGGSELLRRRVPPVKALLGCQLLLVLAIAYASRAIADWLPWWQPTASFLPWVRSSPALTFAFDAVRAAAALLPATVLWGASFPLAVAAVGGGRDAGRPVARVNATNTMGSLVGAIGFTLVGIPVLGSQHSQQALAALAAASTILLCIALRRAAVRVESALAALTVGVVLAMWIVPPVPGRLIAFGRSVNSWDSIRNFLYLEEGATASVAVTEGTGGARQFHIAGKVEASDMDVDMRLERMLGHIPALLHPNPKSVLVVGVGAGVTAGSLTVHPEVERIVICEIEPVVPASARAFFGAENHHVFDDPRTTVVFDDARHFLQTTDETFDIITTDPIHPWVRGAATLYSLEYLQLVRAHLKPGGVVTQWVPLYETDERSVKSQIATFASVFPDTTLWNPDLLEEGYDLVVLGRVAESPIDETALAARINASVPLRQSLEAVTLKSAAAVLSTYAGRGRDLAPWLAGAEINRERQLRLQYLAGLAANSDQRFAIFQGIVRHRRYPADLFAASRETETQLRQWYEP
jgi:spermidine synthase